MITSLFISTAQAAAFTLEPAGSQPTSKGSGTLTGVISSLASRTIDILLVLAAVSAVLYLMYSGFQYITSAGSPERAKTARSGIINAIIGIIVILSAFFIVRFASTIGNEVSCADLPTPEQQAQCRFN